MRYFNILIRHIADRSTYLYNLYG